MPPAFRIPIANDSHNGTLYTVQCTWSKIKFKSQVYKAIILFLFVKFGEEQIYPVQQKNKSEKCYLLFISMFVPGYFISCLYQANSCGVHFLFTEIDRVLYFSLYRGRVHFLLCTGIVVSAMARSNRVGLASSRRNMSIIT
jgi:hypothetical protein